MAPTKRRNNGETSGTSNKRCKAEQSSMKEESIKRVVEYVARGSPMSLQFSNANSPGSSSEATSPMEERALVPNSDGTVPEIRNQIPPNSVNPTSQESEEEDPWIAALDDIAPPATRSGFVSITHNIPRFSSYEIDKMEDLKLPDDVSAIEYPRIGNVQLLKLVDETFKIYDGLDLTDGRFVSVRQLLERAKHMRRLRFRTSVTNTIQNEIKLNEDLDVTKIFNGNKTIEEPKSFEEMTRAVAIGRVPCDGNPIWSKSAMQPSKYTYSLFDGIRERKFHVVPSLFVGGLICISIFSGLISPASAAISPTNNIFDQSTIYSMLTQQFPAVLPGLVNTGIGTSNHPLHFIIEDFLKKQVHGQLILIKSKAQQEHRKYDQLKMENESLLLQNEKLRMENEKLRSMSCHLRTNNNRLEAKNKNLYIEQIELMTSNQSIMDAQQNNGPLLDIDQIMEMEFYA